MSYQELFYYKNGALYWRERKVSGKGANFSKIMFNKPVGYEHRCSRSRTTYLRAKIGREKIMVHRIIWEMHFGDIPEGCVVDHIDGNGMNNNLSNLRIVNKYESARNHPKQSNNKSGVPGISFEKRTKKWVAQIGGGKNREKIGYFADWFDAVCARKSAENRLGYHQNHGRP